MKRLANSTARYFLTFVLTMTLVCGTICCASTYSTGQESSAEKALSSKSYPWYDAETKRVKKVQLPARPSAKSLSREKVALKKAQTNTTAPPGGGAAGQASLLALGWVAWTMIALVIAALAGVLIWAFFRLEANEIDEKKSAPRRSMAESIKQLPFELDDGETGDFRQRAQWNYQNGNYNKATILLFSHVLVSLDQKNHIRLRKGKTNRQYLGEIQHQPPLANYFTPTMVLFETTFFGDHEISKEEFEAAWNRLGDFQTAVNTSNQSTMALEVANA